MTHAVREAAAAVTRTADGAWTVFGARWLAPDAAGAGGEFPVLTNEALANELYWSLHCRVPRDRADARSAPDTWAEPAAFMDQLSRANTGSGPWQSGWTWRARSGARHEVVRAFDVNFVVRTSDVRAPGGGRLRRTAGAPVEVRVASEYRHFAPGYYTALGDIDHQSTTTPTIRVYWNVAPAGASALLAELTNRLNASGIPFRFKTPSDPVRFERFDTGVLYLPQDAYRPALPHLARVHCAVQRFLRAPLSPLIKPLAHGLGAAFDPGDGSSFGAHRCALLAAALLDFAPDETAIAAALSARGYDPRRLYLAPGSRDILTPLAGSPGYQRRAVKPKSRR